MPHDDTDVAHEVDEWTEHLGATDLRGSRRQAWDAAVAIACGMHHARARDMYGVKVAEQQGPGGPWHAYVYVRPPNRRVHGVLELHDGRPVWISIFDRDHDPHWQPVFDADVSGPVPF